MDTSNNFIQQFETNFEIDDSCEVLEVIPVTAENYIETSDESTCRELIQTNNSEQQLEIEAPNVECNTKLNSTTAASYIQHSPSQFECTINNCGRIVKTLRSVLSHAETHQDKSTYKYTCNVPECGKKFLKKYSFELHYRVHTNMRPYICAICSKSFRGSGNLERHFRIHTGAKPYKCLFKNCVKSYSQPENLRIHVRTHTGDRPFCCTHPGCDKNFYAKSNLIAHLRIHQGIKPFVCEICGMAFSENSTCYKHRKIHLKKQEMLERSSTEQNEINANNASGTVKTLQFPLVQCNASDRSIFFTTAKRSTDGNEIINLINPTAVTAPRTTTVFFITTSKPPDTEFAETFVSAENTVVLSSMAEPDTTYYSTAGVHTPSETLLDDDISANEISDFDSDKNTEFSSDVDRSADLGLDTINHKPDASIKVGLDEFMNSIRQDNTQSEYLNSQISFI